MKYAYLSLLAILASLGGMTAQAQAPSSNARNLAVISTAVKFPLIPFNNAAWGNATLGGVHSGDNLVLGTNLVQGAIEAVCYGYYTCGGGGWSLTTPGAPGGTGMSGAENTAAGWYALTQCTTCTFVTAYGSGAAGFEDVGSGETVVGEDAMRNANSQGDTVNGNKNNVVVGNNALRNCVKCQNNVVLGWDAMEGPEGTPPYSTGPNPTGDIAIGTAALQADTTAQNDIAIGLFSGNAINTGNSNVLVGANTGKLLTSTSFNVFVGDGAGGAATTTSSTVLVGPAAGGAGNIGSHNVGVGEHALAAASGDSGNNVAVGSFAGASITTGGANVVIGPTVASTTLTTGAGNILIGTSNAVDAYSAGATNEININNAIRGDVTILTSGSLGSCGTSPAISATATSLAGTITTGSGATACTLTLHPATGNAPTCLVTARSGTAPVYTTSDNGSTASLQLTTAAASAKYDYWCPVH